VCQMFCRNINVDGIANDGQLGLAGCKRPPRVRRLKCIDSSNFKKRISKVKGSKFTESQILQNPFDSILFRQSQCQCYSYQAGGVFDVEFFEEGGGRLRRCVG